MGGAAAETQVPELPQGDTVRQLMKEPRFWLIGGAVFLVSVVDQAFTQHQVLMFQDAGIDGYWQAAGMSAIGLFGIVTRLVVGNILDATSNRGLAILWWVLSASILMAFWLASPVIFIAYIITRAVGHSAVMLDSVTLAKHVWGPSRTLGTLLGSYTAMASAGFAVGPWLMGWLHDHSGSYASTYLIFAALPIVASLLIWRIVPVFWLRLKAEKAGDVRKG
jgi:predicted MFS family arabinose efflux permease